MKFEPNSLVPTTPLLLIINEVAEFCAEEPFIVNEPDTFTSCPNVLP